MKMKFVNIYKDLIRRYYIYIDVHILSTGYLPVSLIPPSQLNEMFVHVKKAVLKMISAFDVVIKRLHLYYHMKLITFNVNEKLDIICSSQYFFNSTVNLCLHYIKLEIVPVHIIDQNINDNSYMKVQVSKPYIALGWWNLYIT